MLEWHQKGRNHKQQEAQQDPEDPWAAGLRTPQAGLERRGAQVGEGQVSEKNELIDNLVQLGFKREAAEDIVFFFDRTPVGNESRAYYDSEPTMRIFHD